MKESEEEKNKVSPSQAEREVFIEHYRRLGLVPVPVKPRSKRLIVSKKELKRLLTLPPHFLENRVDAEFRRYAPQQPNVAVLTGSVSGNLLVLDFDRIEDYWRLAGDVGPLGVIVRTHRGCHVWFHTRKPMPSYLIPIRGSRHIAVKGEGGYVVAPPSTHSSGHQYSFRFPSCIPSEIRLIDEYLEAWLQREAKRPRNRAFTTVDSAISRWLKGYRRYRKDAGPVKTTNMTVEVNRELAAGSLMRLFVNRTDAYAQQGSEGYFTVDEPVTIQLLKEHFMGNRTVGVYLIDPATQTVKTIVWDFDSEQAKSKDEALKIFKPQVNQLRKKLAEHDFTDKNIVIEFSGAKGLHVWLFFDPPIPSMLAYAMGRRIAEQAGLSCEVFPKQEKLLSKYGNLVKLPLGIHRVSALRSCFYTPDWKEADAAYLEEISPAVLLTDDPRVAELKERLIQEYRPWMETQTGSEEPYAGDDPPCVVKYLSGLSVPIGQRHEVFRRIGCYFLKFRGLAGTPEGWDKTRHILDEWNRLNSSPYDTARFEQEWQKLREGYEYNYSCRDSYWMQTCDRVNCPLKRNQLAKFPIGERVTVEDLSPEVRAKAREFLTNPAILYKLGRAVDDKLKCEEANRRLLAVLNEAKQSVEVGGESAAGKNTLVDAVLSMAPEGSWEKLTGLNDKALRYLKKTIETLYLAQRLQHKPGQESTAEYDIKLVLSEGKLRILVTPTRDSDSSDTSETIESSVENIIMTSTDVCIAPELENRIWSLTTDDSKTTTEVVVDSQLEDAATLPSARPNLEHEREIIRAAMMIMRAEAPDEFIIPYARLLKDPLTRFLEGTRLRRDNKKLLALIRYVARFHYTQRPIIEDQGKKVLVVLPSDLWMAWRIGETAILSTFTGLSTQLKASFDVCKKITAGSNGYVTSEALSDETGKSARTAQKHLEELEERGLLKITSIELPEKIERSEKGEKKKRGRRAEVYTTRARDEAAIQLPPEFYAKCTAATEEFLRGRGFNDKYLTKLGFLIDPLLGNSAELPFRNKNVVNSNGAQNETSRKENLPQTAETPQEGQEKRESGPLWRDTT